MEKGGKTLNKNKACKSKSYFLLVFSSSSVKPAFISLAADERESLKFLNPFPKFRPSSGSFFGPKITRATPKITITSGIPRLNGSVMAIL